MKILYFINCILLLMFFSCNSKEVKVIEKTEKKENNESEKIIGFYSGYAKGNTPMELTIERVFNDEIFGYNIISWNKNKPLRSDFIGKYDYNNKIIYIKEDNNVKGAGHFEGTVSYDGNSIEGIWYRYSDNGSYNWSLKKTSN